MYHPSFDPGNLHCPCCGGQDFVVGYQQGDGMMKSATVTMGFCGNKIHHLICRNCGVIAASRVMGTKRYKRAPRDW
ncbi:hypothetical protein [Anaerotruncus rubiinfantis]|uniref:hypothetical protein n=1 Tax=Anaerotruncus rubiinfantis TaxID=1720200 RepID=UPI000836A1A1|nr:hypothetical protein [Anaerotruncus rubiinfantis]